MNPTSMFGITIPLDISVRISNGSYPPERWNTYFKEFTYTFLTSIGWYSAIVYFRQGTPNPIDFRTVAND